jgi:hypothetical protein
MRKKKYDEAIPIYALAKRVSHDKPGRADDFHWMAWHLEDAKDARKSHLVADAKGWLQELQKKIKDADKERPSE